MTILVVTGTDTGIGKTVFAAGLAGALGAHYWKPIQAGIDPEVVSLPLPPPTLPHASTG